MFRNDVTFFLALTFILSLGYLVATVSVVVIVVIGLYYFDNLP